MKFINEIYLQLKSIIKCPFSALQRWSFGAFIQNVTLCICLISVLQGCTAPDIYHDESFNPPVYFGTHVVREGETLYRIAWRYGRDFRELAANNGIKKPYVITPGQKIDLERGGNLSGRGERAGRKEVLHETNVTKGKDSKQFRNQVTKVKKHRKLKNINWAWPHSGPILAKYRVGKKANSPYKLNKGVDIGGSLGDPIFAAAAGEVVYSGSGLLGYGNLVIINHDAQFLSAYAHNRKILVKEGQKITKGQQIAEMGRSGVDRVKLHFEIRKEGKPVDPLKYLPTR